MTDQTFSLIPFPDTKIPEIQITGKVSRNANLLTVLYFLTGNTSNVLLPEAYTQPQRKDDLWKTTCFEFFMALPNHAQYWEFNMSPSGDWNVYHMDAYRRIGLREESAISQLPFLFQNQMESISLEITVDLNSIITLRSPIHMGITSVIETDDGHETYWALTHPGTQPDFHLRESFILTVA